MKPLTTVLHTSLKNLKKIYTNFIILKLNNMSMKIKTVQLNNRPLMPASPPIPEETESCVPAVWRISADWKISGRNNAIWICLEAIKDKAPSVYHSEHTYDLIRWVWFSVTEQTGFVGGMWPYPSSSLLIWSQNPIIYSQSSCLLEGLVALSEK